MAKLFPIAAAIAALLLSMADFSARAAPGLAARDLKFDHRIDRVEITRWKGKPAIMVLSRGGDSRSAGPSNLAIVQLRNGSLHTAAQWDMPRGMRWVEQLPGDGGGWLGLIGTGWYVGRLQGKTIAWRMLCHCETLFSSGEGALPFNARFAQDLNNDGKVEVLLPHWRGLMAYRLNGDGSGLTLIWRDHWQVHEFYELKDDRLRLSMVFPRYVLKDANGDGVRDLIIIGHDNLQVAYHPSPATVTVRPSYVRDARKLAEWRRLGLPATLMAALEAMRPGGYASPAEFRAAVVAAAKNKEDGDWNDAMEEVLRVAREETRINFTSRIDLPGLKEPSHKERYEILSVGDMNGDGVLDLIHVKTTGKGRILDQKNQLRWYEGSRKNGRLAFVAKPHVFFSEGPAIAELVYPKRKADATPMLVLATTEVGLMAIIRAFTFNEVTLDLFVYPWRDGKLLAPPPVSGNLDFEISGNDKKNRPKVLLADLDADGQREYLFNMDTDTLTAFRGTAQGPDFGAEPVVEVAVGLPERKTTILVEDLDGDGREELVFWYKRGGKDNSLLHTLRVMQLVENLEQGKGKN